jgi:hypothetical protein
MYGERMDRPGKLFGKRRVDHPVPLNPAPAGKGGRHQSDTEMRLPLRPRPRMPGVQMRLVDHPEAIGAESNLQLLLDPGLNRHDAATLFRDDDAP